jgi:hypothetical protein
MVKVVACDFSRRLSRFRMIQCVDCPSRREKSQRIIRKDVSPSETDAVGDKSSFSFANRGLHIHLPLKELACSSSFEDECDEEHGSVFLWFSEKGLSGTIYLKGQMSVAQIL